MQQDDCIFCKIASGEIPSNIIYETDELVAFPDANPKMPTHVLIVPKDHYSSLSDDIPLELLGKLLKAVLEVAKIEGIFESGYRVIINTGDDACQTVKHIHVHVLGGKRMQE